MYSYPPNLIYNRLVFFCSLCVLNDTHCYHWTQIMSSCCAWCICSDLAHPVGDNLWLRLPSRKVRGQSYSKRGVFQEKSRAGLGTLAMWTLRPLPTPTLGVARVGCRRGGTPLHTPRFCTEVLFVPSTDYCGHQVSVGLEGKRLIDT